MKPACAALAVQLAAYADDELGVDAAIAIERHLSECAGCRRAVARQRELARALRGLRPLAEPPAGFEARVRHAVVGSGGAARRAVATAAVVVLALVGVLGVAQRMRGDALRHPDETPAARRASVAGSARDDDPIRAHDRRDGAPALAAAVALHRDLDDRTLAFAATSGDVAGVNAWLRARLPFAADVRAPGSPAIALQGATVVSLGDRAAGLVRYRMQGRAVSLFLSAAPAWDEQTPPVRVGAMEFHVDHRAGADVVGWSHARLSYLLVADDGLATGAACAACHGADGRRAIAEFVRAVRGDAADA